MKGSQSRTRHLIFMVHLIVCAPFLVIWLYVPSVREDISVEAMKKLDIFIPLACLYLLIRTILAYKDPPWLNWEYVFPPIDVGIVSGLIYVGNRDPLSNVAILYLFPLAAAAGTLSTWWAASVAGMVLVGVALATYGHPISDPYNTAFRYFLLLVMASLLTSLARAAAVLREQLAIARDRNRIALEMHDGVQGHLMTIASQLELAQHLAVKSPERTAKIAGESRETARLAADELRFLVQRMRAPSLRAGFLPALRQFAHNQTSRNGLSLDFEVVGDPYDLDPETENALFRIAQESLNNTLRHARASRVDVCIRFLEDRIELEVADDGVGFDPVEPGSEAGMHAGLESMRKRATDLGGDIWMQSENGKGARVRACIPRYAATMRT